MPLFFLLSLPARAQQFRELYPDPILAGGSVGWADYDQDGDPDLAITGAMRSQSGITLLYRNDSDHFTEVDYKFEVARDRFSGSFLKWLDWENDGDMDLVISGPHFRIFKNEGGTFTPEPQFSAMVFNFIDWKDVDRDGDEDVLGIQYIGPVGDIEVFMLRFEAGQFTYVELKSQVPGANAVDMADFSGDGVPDLLIRKGTDINIYTHRDGYYELDTTNSFVAPFTASISSFDYDDDNDADIVVTGQLNKDDRRSRYLYLNNAGKFTLVNSALLDSDVWWVANIDTDDDVDFLKRNRADSSMVVYENRDQGAYAVVSNPIFEQFQHFEAAYAGRGTEADAYLAVSGQLVSGNESTQLYRKEKGKYKRLYPNPLDQLMFSPLVQWVDYDADGKKDIYISGRVAASSMPGYTAKLYRNTGEDFVEAHQLDRERVSDGRWVDFDRDGYPELMTVIEKEVLLHQGFHATTGGTTRVLLKNVTRHSYPTVIDFDQDGDNDLMFDGFETGIYVNDKNALTYKTKFGPSLYGVSKPAWADYDLDGDLDVALFAEGFLNDRVEVYRNTRQEFEGITGTPFPRLYNAQLYWIDYNLDAYPDLLVTGNLYSQPVVKLYTNRKGVFTEATGSSFAEILDLTEVLKIQIVDFNVDGYPDIVAGGEGKSVRKLVFYQNKGGVFAPYTGHGIPALSAFSFDWGDFDNDGDPDLLYCGGGDLEQTQVYVNQTVDAFGPVVHCLLPRAGQTVAPGALLQVVFHEPVAKGSGKLKIHSKSTGKLLYEVAVNDPSVGIRGDTVSVQLPAAAPAEGGEVYVLVDEAAFKDAKGNPSAGIRDVAQWNFTVSGGSTAKAPQNITFAAIGDKTFTDPDVSLRATADSGLPVSFSVVSGRVTLSGGKLKIDGAGPATVRAYQAGNERYDSASVSQSFTVKKAPQSLNFPAIGDKLSNVTPFTLEGTATSGLPVAFSVLSGPAVLSGATLTVTGGGQVQVEAFQGGNENYLPARAGQSFNVNTVLAVGTARVDGLAVFPNPVTNLLTIKLPPHLRQASLALYNAKGLLVWQEEARGREQVWYRTGPLPRGVYWLRLAHGRATTTEKIVLH